MLKHKTIITLTFVMLLFTQRLSAQQSDQTAGQPQRPPDPAAQQQAALANFKAPDNLDFRRVNIISEGVRMYGELFSLKSLAGKKLTDDYSSSRLGWHGCGLSA